MASTVGVTSSPIMTPLISYELVLVIIYLRSRVDASNGRFELYHSHRISSSTLTRPANSHTAEISPQFVRLIASVPFGILRPRPASAISHRRLTSASTLSCNRSFRTDTSTLKIGYEFSNPEIAIGNIVSSTGAANTIVAISVS